MEDNYDEILINDVKQHPDWFESLVTELPTSTEALGKESQELNMVSSQGRKDSSCVDQKVWCKFADCSLENVRRNCQKTCNIIVIRWQFVSTIFRMNRSSVTFCSYKISYAEIS